jgi:16S rRNA (guanine527-N7)-methyltransferase
MFHVKHSQAEGLRQYVSLIRKYHATLDLMSSAGLEDVEHQVEDSLAYADLLEQRCQSGDHVLDVGSGVGLPAIPVAVRLPYLQFYLVEKRRKRVAFLQMVVGRLELANVTVVSGDVSAATLPPCTFILAQAVGSFEAVYCLTRHLHTAEITLMSRKSPAWQDEVEGLKERLRYGEIEIHEVLLATRGRLVALHLPGGRPCPSSA